jgi:hypothetical protein
MARARTYNPNTPLHYHTINFHHLRYAVAAADHGSFRSAAETLMIQLSTLSRCIRQLEQANFRCFFALAYLFDRTDENPSRSSISGAALATSIAWRVSVLALVTVSGILALS